MDLTGNCRVGLADFALLARDWLTDYDSEHLVALADEWLVEGVRLITWVEIDDPNFVGEMSRYETTNAQYAVFLNAALQDGLVAVDANDVTAVGGDYAGQILYQLDQPGLTQDEEVFGEGRAINGGASRIVYSDGVFSVADGFNNHPVTYVTWYGASAFADYYGWRLPTEAEWMGVADFDGSYIYGCGPEIDPTLANYAYSYHPDGTLPVGSFGLFGYGMADMAGNVFEWTSSLAAPDDPEDRRRILKGGTWAFFDHDCEVSSWFEGGPGPILGDGGSLVGFRVCR